METKPKQEFILTRWIDRSSMAGGIIGAFCLLIISVIITYEALMRYAFNAPTTWVKEISIYLCIAIGFLAAANTLKQDGHFSITVLVDKLKPKNRRILKTITILMGILYSGVFVYKGVDMVMFSYEIEEVSSSLLEVPLWIPQLFLPIGAFLLLLQFINKLTTEIKQF